MNLRTSSPFRRIAILAFLILAVQTSNSYSVQANELAWQTYNDAGQRFVNARNFAQAEEVLTHAINAAREMKSNEHLKTSLGLMILAYDALKKPDLAERARKELDALGGVVPPAPVAQQAPVATAGGGVPVEAPAGMGSSSAAADSSPSASLGASAPAPSSVGVPNKVGGSSEFDGLGFGSEKPIRFAAGTGEPISAPPSTSETGFAASRSVTGFTQSTPVQNSVQAPVKSQTPTISAAGQDQGSESLAKEESVQESAQSHSTKDTRSVPDAPLSGNESQVSQNDASQKEQSESAVKSAPPSKKKSKQDAFADAADSQTDISQATTADAAASYGSYDQDPGTVSGSGTETEVDTSRPGSAASPPSTDKTTTASVPDTDQTVPSSVQAPPTTPVDGSEKNDMSESGAAKGGFATGSSTAPATTGGPPTNAAPAVSNDKLPPELQDMEGGTDVERLIRSLARQQAGLPPLANKPGVTKLPELQIPQNNEGESKKTGTAAGVAPTEVNKTAIDSNEDSESTAVTTDPAAAVPSSNEKDAALNKIASALPVVAAAAATQSATELRQMQGHIDWIKTIAFAPDTNFAASAGSDQIVRYWDVNTGKAISEFKGHKGDINGVAFSRDGSKLVSASDDKTVRLFNVASATEEQVFNGHKNLVTCAALSPDMKRVASGGYDNSIIVWNAGSGSQVGSLTGHTAVVRDIMFSPDGQKIVSCSDDRTIIVWNAKTLKPITTLQGHENYVLNVDISEDGKQLLSAGRDLTARLWDLENGKLLQTMRGHSDWILRVKFMKGSNQAVTGSLDKTVRIWDLSSGALQSTVDGFNWGVFGEDFAADKKLVLTGSNDKTVRVWSLPH